MAGTKLPGFVALDLILERVALKDLVSKVVRDLRRRGRKRPSPGPARGQLATYDVSLRMTPAERRELEKRASEHMRSLSSYVAALIAASLRAR